MERATLQARGLGAAQGGNDLDRVMTGFPFQKKQAKAHTIKYGTRIKTIPKHVQLVPEKYRSIFVGNKIAGKNTAIDDEIRRLPALIENTDVSQNFFKLYIIIQATLATLYYEMKDFIYISCCYL